MTLKDNLFEIEELQKQLLDLQRKTLREAQELAEEGDDDVKNRLVDLLETSKWQKSDLRDLENQANEALVTIMDQSGTRKFESGMLTIERKVSNCRSNWQNDVLLRSVVNTCLDEIQQRSYVDQDTGEKIDERNIIAPWMEAIVERLLKCAAFRDWRVTALRAHIPGLDPDNFCDTKRSIKAVISRGKG